VSDAALTPEQVAEALVAVLHEPWLDKRGLAAHYCCEGDEF
jgi:hypothetical protein